MEDYPMKFRLIRDNGLISWRKLGDPQNWIKMGCHIGRITVEKTSQNIIVHTGQLSGFDPDQLLIEAGQIIGVVKVILKDKGVELGEYGIPLHKPMFKFYTPEAEEFNKKYGVVSTPEGTIDCSPPDKEPHAEWNRNASVNYLEMPNRLKRLEDKLSRIEALEEKCLQLQEKQIQLQERQIQATEKNTEALEGIPRKMKPDTKIGII